MQRTLLGIVCMLLTMLTAQAQSNYSNQNTSKVNWLTFEEAIQKNKENPKKVLVDLYTEWCTWCTKMEKGTFDHPAIAEYINENFYPVKLDAETKGNITFKGNTYSFRPEANRRGVHEIAIYLTRKKLNYPSVIFLDEGMNNPQPIGGFINPIEMDKLLHFFDEDYYLEIDWSAFSTFFKSSLEEPRYTEGTNKAVYGKSVPTTTTAKTVTPKTITPNNSINPNAARKPITANDDEVKENKPKKVASVEPKVEVLAKKENDVAINPKMDKEKAVKMQRKSKRNKMTKFKEDRKAASKR